MRKPTETSLNVRTQMFLIVFDGQHVIPATRHDLGRDRFLAAHGVDGHQCSLHVDGEDVAQEMTFAAVEARVLETANVLVQGQA